jgi:hypothetical protein
MEREIANLGDGPLINNALAPVPVERRTWNAGSFAAL